MPTAAPNLNLNNNQSQLSKPEVTTGGNTVTFGGNALGGAGAGSSASTSTTGGGTGDLSNILLYGGIALVVVFVLKHLF